MFSHNQSDYQQYKQIGNAVPVPLALALGKSVGEVLSEVWRKTDAQLVALRQESPEIAMNID